MFVPGAFISNYDHTAGYPVQRSELNSQKSSFTIIASITAEFSASDGTELQYPKIFDMSFVVDSPQVLVNHRQKGIVHQNGTHFMNSVSSVLQVKCIFENWGACFESAHDIPNNAMSVWGSDTINLWSKCPSLYE